MDIIRTIIGAITVLFYLIVLVMAAFDEAPISVEVPVGSEAVFRCRHSTADIIRWRVNETLLGNNRPTDITSESDSLVYTLTIEARLDYNGTTIVCVARFDDGSPDETSQPPAVLRVQAFIEIPVSQSVFVEETAMFRCRHSMTDTIEWMINGSRLSTDNPMPGISNGTMMESGNMVHTLTITGEVEYDNTSVVARALLPDGSVDDSTPIAVLKVFVRFPTSLNVSSGSEAVFRCGHRNATTIGWTVDGGNANNNPDFRQNNNGTTGSLTITAHPQYNLSMVRCLAFFIDRPNEISPPADLWIQGPLAAVANLTKVGSTLSWEAPFSMNLTNIDPDIVYCVDVYNITCGGRDLVSSDCHVTDTNYTAFSDGYLYEYIVTPRSKVEGAGNGTSSQWRDTLPAFTIPSTQLSHALPTSPSLRNYQIELAYSPALPIPSSYTLSLEALDGLDSLSRVETTATAEQPNQLLLNVSGLESRRLWNCTILAFGCQENSILRGEILNTHDFRDISISPPFAGAVRVTGRYTEGSPATGVLVIVSGDSDSYYHIATRDGSDIQEATITGIAGGEYSVSVFVVEENGLPFERAATVPNRLSVEGNNVERPSPSIDYSLEYTSSGVCVKCTFLDTDTSECIAIVHSESDLMNIESSHKFNRSGDTASGCIEGVNLEDYLVGVVGGKLLKSGLAQTSNSAVIIGGSISTVVILAVIVLVLVMIVNKYWHKLATRSRDKKSPQLNLYSPAPPTENPRDPLVIPSSGGIYDTVVDIDSTPSSTHFSSSSGARSSSASTASTSDGDISEVNKKSTIYSPVYVKPQPVRVPPADDSRVVYTEVNKTQGAKEQLYAMVNLKKGITESNPDDLTKVIYSDICTGGIQRPSTVFKTNSCDTLLTFKVPPPVPFTAENVCTVLLPVASKWQVIGEAFPLSEKRLDDIDTTEGDEECLRQMIGAYMLRSDLSHTWDEIVNVLKEIPVGEDSLADKIFEMHVAPYVMTLPNQPQVPETLTNDHVSKSLQNLHKGCRDDRNPDASMSAVSYCSEQGAISQPRLSDNRTSTVDHIPDSALLEDVFENQVQLPTSTPCIDETSHESTEEESGLGRSRVDTDSDSELSEGYITSERDSKEDSTSQGDKETSTDASDKFSDMDSGYPGCESPQPVMTSFPVCNPSRLSPTKWLPTGGMPPSQLVPSSTALEKDIGRAPFCIAEMTINDSTVLEMPPVSDKKSNVCNKEIPRRRIAVDSGNFIESQENYSQEKEKDASSDSAYMSTEASNDSETSDVMRVNMCTQDNDCPADISEHGESLFSAPLGSEQQSADEICGRSYKAELIKTLKLSDKMQMTEKDYQKRLHLRRAHKDLWQKRATLMSKETEVNETFETNQEMEETVVFSADDKVPNNDTQDENVLQSDIVCFNFYFLL